MQPYSKYKPTNIPWLPQIPEGWTYRRFRFIANISNLSNDDEKLRPMFSLSAYNGIQKKEYEFESSKRTKEDSLTYNVVKKNQLVVNPMWVINNSIGVSFIEEEGIVSPAYRVYKLLPNINPEFCHYLMRSHFYTQDYNRYIRGLTTYDRSVRKEDFHDIPIILPSLEEQNTIVNFLNSKISEIDTFIANKQKMIELLNEKKKAIINQAVTKGINPDVKLKPSGIEWLGDIPEHWEIKKLKYVADIIVSNVDKITSDEFNEISVSLCNYVDVYKNEFITSELPFMKATAKQTEIERFVVKERDVIVTKDSETAQDIAKPAFVEEAIQGLICGYHLAIIRSSKDFFINEFLFRLFQSKNINIFFELSANGITRYGLSMYALKNVKIPIPPLMEQQKIVSFLKEELLNIELSKLTILKEIALIQEYKTTLISDAVTGKIYVAPREISKEVS